MSSFSSSSDSGATSTFDLATTTSLASSSTGGGSLPLTAFTLWSVQVLPSVRFFLCFLSDLDSAFKSISLAVNLSTKKRSVKFVYLAILVTSKVKEEESFQLWRFWPFVALTLRRAASGQQSALTECKHLQTFCLIEGVLLGCMSGFVVDVQVKKTPRKKQPWHQLLLLAARHTELE
jgi:uncharacterized membrane protein